MNEEFHGDDIDFEPDDELGDIGALTAKLKKLKTELEQVKRERQEYLDGWQRCKADAINAKKDAEAYGKRAAELLREALVHDIIPALDSFDAAVGSESWTEISNGFRSGMENVRNQLIDALKRHGIERYGKVGERFDHSLHEAVEEREDIAGEAGTIVRILRYGYRMGDRILRAAHVVVKA